MIFLVGAVGMLGIAVVLGVAAFVAVVNDGYPVQVVACSAAELMVIEMEAELLLV